jgi:hypothetical protein
MIYLLTHFENRLRDYFLIIGLMVLIFFTRPTGVIVVMSVIAFMLKYHGNLFRNKPALRVATFVLHFILTYTSADFMLSRWDFTDQFKRGNIITYMDTIEGEPLYDKNLRIDVSNIVLKDYERFSVATLVSFVYQNPTYFFKAACLKVWYLLSATRPYYSIGHNVYSLLWVLSVYVLYFFGWRSTDHIPLKVFTLSMILFNCALVGISSVDWDNRFYIPMEPGLVLLAGGGLSYLADRFNLY